MKLTFEQAIFKRIQEIADERNIKISRLALLGGITPSTLYDLRTKNNAPRSKTLKRMCDGIGMKLSEFFDKDYIDESVLLDD